MSLTSRSMTPSADSRSITTMATTTSFTAFTSPPSASSSAAASGPSTQRGRKAKFKGKTIGVDKSKSSVQSIDQSSTATVSVASSTIDSAPRPVTSPSLPTSPSSRPPANGSASRAFARFGRAISLAPVIVPVPAPSSSSSSSYDSKSQSNDAVAHSSTGASPMSIWTPSMSNVAGEDIDIQAGWSLRPLPPAAAAYAQSLALASQSHNASYASLSSVSSEALSPLTASSSYSSSSREVSPIRSHTHSTPATPVLQPIQPQLHAHTNLILRDRVTSGSSNANNANALSGAANAAAGPNRNIIAKAARESNLSSSLTSYLQNQLSLYSKRGHAREVMNMLMEREEEMNTNDRIDEEEEEQQIDTNDVNVSSTQSNSNANESSYSRSSPPPSFAAVAASSVPSSSSRAAVHAHPSPSPPSRASRWSNADGSSATMIYSPLPPSGSGGDNSHAPSLLRTPSRQNPPNQSRLATPARTEAAAIRELELMEEEQVRRKWSACSSGSSDPKVKPLPAVTLFLPSAHYDAHASGHAPSTPGSAKFVGLRPPRQPSSSSSPEGIIIVDGRVADHPSVRVLNSQMRFIRAREEKEDLFIRQTMGCIPAPSSSSSSSSSSSTAPAPVASSWPSPSSHRRPGSDGLDLFGRALLSGQGSAADGLARHDALRATSGDPVPSSLALRRFQRAYMRRQPRDYRPSAGGDIRERNHVLDYETLKRRGAGKRWQDSLSLAKSEMDAQERKDANQRLDTAFSRSASLMQNNSTGTSQMNPPNPSRSHARNMHSLSYRENDTLGGAGALMASEDRAMRSRRGGKGNHIDRAAHPPASSSASPNHSYAAPTPSNIYATAGYTLADYARSSSSSSSKPLLSNGSAGGSLSATGGYQKVHRSLGLQFHAAASTASASSSFASDQPNSSRRADVGANGDPLSDAQLVEREQAAEMERWKRQLNGEDEEEAAALPIVNVSKNRALHSSSSPSVILPSIASSSASALVHPAPSVSTSVLDFSDRNGSTPLFHSAWEGFTSIISLLCLYGADVNVRNIRRNTAMDMSVERGHGDIVRCLLRYGSDGSYSEAKSSRARCKARLGSAYTLWLARMKQGKFLARDPGEKASKGKRRGSVAPTSAASASAASSALPSDAETLHFLPLHVAQAAADREILRHFTHTIYVPIQHTIAEGLDDFSMNDDDEGGYAQVTNVVSASGANSIAPSSSSKGVGVGATLANLSRDGRLLRKAKLVQRRVDQAAMAARLDRNRGLLALSKSFSGVADAVDAGAGVDAHGEGKIDLETYVAMDTDRSLIRRLERVHESHRVAPSALVRASASLAALQSSGSLLAPYALANDPLDQIADASLNDYEYDIQSMHQCILQHRAFHSGHAAVLRSVASYRRLTSDAHEVYTQLEGWIDGLELGYAVLSGDLASVDRLLIAHPEQSALVVHGCSLVYHASYHGFYSIARSLIAASIEHRLERQIDRDEMVESATNARLQGLAQFHSRGAADRAIQAVHDEFASVDHPNYDPNIDPSTQSYRLAHDRPCAYYDPSDPPLPAVVRSTPLSRWNSTSPRYLDLNFLNLDLLRTGDEINLDLANEKLMAVRSKNRQLRQQIRLRKSEMLKEKEGEKQRRIDMDLSESDDDEQDEDDEDQYEDDDEMNEDDMIQANQRIMNTHSSTPTDSSGSGIPAIPAPRRRRRVDNRPARAASRLRHAALNAAADDAQFVLDSSVDRSLASSSPSSSSASGATTVEANPLQYQLWHQWRVEPKLWNLHLSRRRVEEDRLSKSRKSSGNIGINVVISGSGAGAGVGKGALAEIGEEQAAEELQRLVDEEEDDAYADSVRESANASEASSNASSRSSLHSSSSATTIGVHSSASASRLPTVAELSGSPAAPGVRYETAIFVAIQRKHYRVALLLNEFGAISIYNRQQLMILCDIQIRSRKLMKAIRRRDYTQIERILQYALSGADANGNVVHTAPSHMPASSTFSSVDDHLHPSGDQLLPQLLHYQESNGSNPILLAIQKNDIRCMSLIKRATTTLHERQQDRLMMIMMPPSAGGHPPTRANRTPVYDATFARLMSQIKDRLGYSAMDNSLRTTIMGGGANNDGGVAGADDADSGLASTADGTDMTTYLLTHCGVTISASSIVDILLNKQNEDSGVVHYSINYDGIDRLKSVLANAVRISSSSSSTAVPSSSAASRASSPVPARSVVNFDEIYTVLRANSHHLTREQRFDVQEFVHSIEDDHVTLRRDASMVAAMGADTNDATTTAENNSRRALRRVEYEMKFNESNADMEESLLLNDDSSIRSSERSSGRQSRMISVRRPPLPHHVQLSFLSDILDDDMSMDIETVYLERQLSSMDMERARLATRADEQRKQIEAMKAELMEDTSASGSSGSEDEEGVKIKRRSATDEPPSVRSLLMMSTSGAILDTLFESPIVTRHGSMTESFVVGDDANVDGVAADGDAINSDNHTPTANDDDAADTAGDDTASVKVSKKNDVGKKGAKKVQPAPPIRPVSDSSGDDDDEHEEYDNEGDDDNDDNFSINSLHRSSSQSTTPRPGPPRAAPTLSARAVHARAISVAARATASFSVSPSLLGIAPKRALLVLKQPGSVQALAKPRPPVIDNSATTPSVFIPPPPAAPILPPHDYLTTEVKCRLCWLLDDIESYDLFGQYLHDSARHTASVVESIAARAALAVKNKTSTSLDAYLQPQNVIRPMSPLSVGLRDEVDEHAEIAFGQVGLLNWKYILKANPYIEPLLGVDYPFDLVRATDQPSIEAKSADAAALAPAVVDGRLLASTSADGMDVRVTIISPTASVVSSSTNDSTTPSTRRPAASTSASPSIRTYSSALLPHETPDPPHLTLTLSSWLESFQRLARHSGIGTVIALAEQLEKAAAAAKVQVKRVRAVRERNRQLEVIKAKSVDDEKKAKAHQEIIHSPLIASQMVLLDAKSYDAIDGPSTTSSVAASSIFTFVPHLNPRHHYDGDAMKALQSSRSSGEGSHHDHGGSDMATIASPMGSEHRSEDGRE